MKQPIEVSHVKVGLHDSNAQVPDRDLLCIFVPLAFGSDNFGAPIATALLACPLLFVDVGMVQYTIVDLMNLYFWTMILETTKN